MSARSSARSSVASLPSSVEDRPELQVHGSGNLIQALLRHNHVDQYRLWVFPLVIGSGKRLFSAGSIASGLELVDSSVSTTGVVSVPTSRWSETVMSGRGTRSRNCPTTGSGSPRGRGAKGAAGHVRGRRRLAPLRPQRNRLSGRAGRQTGHLSTSARTRAPKKTLWTLCTAIPTSALL
jgi:hypothetical protein